MSLHVENGKLGWCATSGTPCITIFNLIQIESMFHIIWAIIFIIKLYKSVANAPKFKISLAILNVFDAKEFANFVPVITFS